MIELTEDEAKKLAMIAIPKEVFEAYSLEMRINAIVGIIVIIRALQQAGYRISRPLEVVP